jgi:hypothetical protein
VTKNRALTLLLTSLLLMALLFSTATAATTETFTVTPPSTIQYTFHLPKDTTFNGSISTSGTLRVWVTNSSGAQIVNIGLIGESADFSFVANVGGNYSVNFENDLPKPVQVTFTYDTTPELPNADSSIVPLNYLPFFIAIVVLGSLLIFFLVRRNKKSKR